MSKYKRVLLKLSGEALAGDKGTGFDEATCVPVAKQIKDLVDAGTEVAIVIGGGNFWRGRSSETIDRTKADQIGMMATVMNCIYMSEICRSVGLMTQVLTPFSCGSFTKLFSKDRVNKYLGKGMDIRIFQPIPQRHFVRLKLMPILFSQRNPLMVYMIPTRQ